MPVCAYIELHRPIYAGCHKGLDQDCRGRTSPGPSSQIPVLDHSPSSHHSCPYLSIPSSSSQVCARHSEKPNGQKPQHLEDPACPENLEEHAVRN